MPKSDALINFFKPSLELLEKINMESLRLEIAATNLELGRKEDEGLELALRITELMPGAQAFVSEEFCYHLAFLAEGDRNQFNPLAIADRFLTTVFWGGASLNPPEVQKNSIVKWNEEFLKWLKEEHNGFYKLGWGEIKLENDQLVLVNYPPPPDDPNPPPPLTLTFTRIYPSQKRRP